MENNSSQMSFKSEDEYKKDVIAALSADFDIEAEAEGEWPWSNNRYKLDFLLTPKPHLVDKGFDASVFGIEVKSPLGCKEKDKKLLDAVIQAHSYTMCRFNGKIPSFVLIYPEIKYFFLKHPELPIGECPEDYESYQEVRTVRRLMQRANVGELRLLPGDNYKIFFGDCRYYDTKRGRSKIKNLGMVRRIGSQKVN